MVKIAVKFFVHFWIDFEYWRSFFVRKIKASLPNDIFENKFKILDKKETNAF